MIHPGGMQEDINQKFILLKFDRTNKHADELSQVKTRKILQMYHIVSLVSFVFSSFRLAHLKHPGQTD